MSVCLSSFNLLSSPDRLGEASESGGVAHVAVDVTFCVFLFLPVSNLTISFSCPSKVVCFGET